MYIYIYVYILCIALRILCILYNIIYIYIYGWWIRDSSGIWRNIIGITYGIIIGDSDGTRNIRLVAPRSKSYYSFSHAFMNLCPWIYYRLLDLWTIRLLFVIIYEYANCCLLDWRPNRKRCPWNHKRLPQFRAFFSATFFGSNEFERFRVLSHTRWQMGKGLQSHFFGHFQMFLPILTIIGLGWPVSTDSYLWIYFWKPYRRSRKTWHLSPKKKGEFPLWIFPTQPTTWGKKNAPWPLGTPPQWNRYRPGETKVGIHDPNDISWMDEIIWLVVQ